MTAGWLSSEATQTLHYELILTDVLDSELVDIKAGM